jgi:hypothetical protein
MSAKVFISYRRDDSAGHAGRVHDRLARELGPDLLFMDVDGIPLGRNFVKVLQEEVAKCSVLLAVIGREWLDACDENGRRRLDSPNDFVRVEIAAALQRDIPVIPILLEGTKVPRADQLPDDLQELALRNGLGVRHSSFHSDMDILIRQLKLGLAGAEQRVQSLTPGDHGAAIRGTTRGDGDTTPILRSAQETTRQSDVQGPPHQAANRAVSGEQQAVAPAARRRNKATAEPRAPSDAKRPPDGAPRTGIRSRSLFNFIGLAIVVIGAVCLVWIATGPRDSTTAVTPVANTASTPRDGTTAVTPVANTASTPRDGTTAVTPLVDAVLGVVPPPLFGSTTSPKNAASGAQNSVSPSELDKIQEGIRALSKSQEELSKVMDEQDKKAREAIERIRSGQ